MVALGRWLIAASALLCLPSHAGTASGSFVVMVQPVGICVSSTLSQQTNATVWVTCKGEHFVSIEPRPGKAFLGSHGGAWRFQFSANAVLPVFFQGPGSSQTGVGMGTVTALRVLGLQERDETLEMLVSF